MPILPVFASVAPSLAADGWPVFPLVPRTKSPYKGSNGHKDATNDPGLVSRWARERPRANVGIRPPAEVIVLDEDERGILDALGPLPPTREVWSRRGRHLYFRLPIDIGPSPSKLTVEGERLPVDLKRHNGFVIAEGSIHPSGSRYRLVDTTPPDRLPMLPEKWWPWVRHQAESGVPGERTVVGTKATQHHPRRLGEQLARKNEGERREFLKWALCQAHRNYQGDELRVALEHLNWGTLRCGLPESDYIGLLGWAAEQFTISEENN